MDGLLRLVETSAVSYQLNAQCFLTTPLLGQSGLLSRSGHNWLDKAFLAWLFNASIYVLEFLVLVSAATGGVSPSTENICFPLRWGMARTRGTEEEKSIRHVEVSPEVFFDPNGNMKLTSLSFSEPSLNVML